MFDLTNAPTVEEYVKENGYTKLWLCPSAVSTGRIGIEPIFRGYECSASSIPEKIKTKKVRKHFRENGVHCIIWENDEDKEFKG